MDTFSDSPLPAASAGDDDAFSAWNLSVDDPPPPVLPKTPARPLSSAPAPAQTAPARPKQRGLSPLQRAVVWAELLGTPKGLEG